MKILLLLAGVVSSVVFVAIEVISFIEVVLQILARKDPDNPHRQQWEAMNPSPADIAAGRSQSWTPKYPGAAVSPEQGRYDKPQSGGAAYEHAPSSSHVYGWKMLEGGFVSKFYGPSVGAPPGTIAVLTVAFKEQRRGQTTGNIGSEYEYYFADASTAAKWLEDFRTNPHPGHVVQALERAGVRYKRKH